MSELQTPQEKQIIFFYSSRCQECAKFNKLLEEYPEINSNIVQRICVEQLNPRQIPRELTHVPAIVINSQLIMGPNAFKWLEEEVSNLVVSQDPSDFKGGASFSFIGDQNDNYVPGQTSFLEEVPDTGSNINPNNFDPKNGQPIQQQQLQYNPNPPVQQQSQYNPSQQHNYYNQQQQSQQQSHNQSQQQLPPQLRPQKVENDGKLGNMDLDKLTQMRNSDCIIPKQF